MSKEERKPTAATPDSIVDRNAQDNAVDPKADAITQFIEIKNALSGSNPSWPMPALDEKLR